MKVKILKSADRPLLSRQRIFAEVEFEAAVPARQDIIKSIAEQSGTKPELVVVKKIDPSFGSHKASVAAYVYKNKADLDRIEEKKKLAKTGFKEAKKEEPKQEAPKAE